MNIDYIGCYSNILCTLNLLDCFLLDRIQLKLVDMCNRSLVNHLKDLILLNVMRIA